MDPHRDVFGAGLDGRPAVPAAEACGPGELTQVAQRLRVVGEKLRAREVDDVLAVLDRVVDTWLNPTSRWRRAAEELLPSATGFSPEMIRYGLPAMFEPLRSPALTELLDRELGDRRVLDGMIDGRRAVGPRLILHVLSGNLAGTGVIPVALSLAVKAPALVKVASGDRLTALMFARSIAAVDAELGSAVAVVYWRGGDLACERDAFALAELVVMSGSDASVEDARTRCASEFIGYGHKVSLAVVTREVLADGAAARAAAEALALDVSLWDQRGCLSPQICFVETDFDGACRFGELVAAELGRLVTRLPPGEVTIDEAAAVRRFRDEAEWSRIGGGRTVMFASEGSIAWTVLIEAEAVFRPTPLCRSLRVLPIESITVLPQVLGPAARVLECAGLAAPEARRGEVVETLARAGLRRLCPLGRMQYPPLSWPQGGRPRVAHWVKWVGVEGREP